MEAAVARDVGGCSDISGISDDSSSLASGLGVRCCLRFLAKLLRFLGMFLLLFSLTTSALDPEVWSSSLSEFVLAADLSLVARLVAGVESRLSAALPRLLINI